MAGLVLGGVLIGVGVALPGPDPGDFSTESALVEWLRASMMFGTAASAIAGLLLAIWVVMRTPIGFASRLIARSERFAVVALVAGVGAAVGMFLARASIAPVAGASAARSSELLLELQVLTLLVGLAALVSGAVYAILTRAIPHRGQYWLHKD